MKPGEPILFVKYDQNQFNMLDVEKKALILKDSIPLDSGKDILLNFHLNFLSLFLSFLSKVDPFGGTTTWIDCCPTNENLLATCGSDKSVKIYDRRRSNVVRNLSKLHEGNDAQH